MAKNKKPKNKKEVQLTCNAQVSIITKSNGKKAEKEFLYLLLQLEEYCFNNGIEVWVDTAYIDQQEI